MRGRRRECDPSNEKGMGKAIEREIRKRIEGYEKSVNAGEDYKKRGIEK